MLSGWAPAIASMTVLGGQVNVAEQQVVANSGKRPDDPR
jgi:hypothetical protein